MLIFHLEKLENAYLRQQLEDHLTYTYLILISNVYIMVDLRRKDFENR